MDHTSIENEPQEDRCACEEKQSIPFLDTSLSIENGRIEIDLHRKKTDRNQYLLPSSCHPKTTTLAIPYSLSLRIIRICTKTEIRDKRLAELKNLLIARDYPEGLVTRAIERARKIPRKIALLKIRKKATENRPVFSIKYDPRLPSIPQVVAKHWRSMITQNKYLKECFVKQPLTAYRRQNNLRNFLIKSKVAPPPPTHPKRNLSGMNTCGKSCTACPYVQKGRYLKIDGQKTWEIRRKVNCNSFNIIYILICKKCQQKYIGTSGRQLQKRLADHRGYISTQVESRATGAHFNLPGHSLADLSVTILEQTKSDPEYRREREKYFIRKFDTVNNGINKEW